MALDEASAGFAGPIDSCPAMRVFTYQPPAVPRSIRLARKSADARLSLVRAALVEARHLRARSSDRRFARDWHEPSRKDYA